MRGFLKAIVLVPVAIVVVLFAVANRGPLTLSLDPLAREAPAITLTLPVFVVIFAALMTGVLIGGMATWLRQGRYRKAARENRRECERLEAEARRLREARAPTPAPAAGEAPLALPARPGFVST
jgi:uncharacterized integral membrane protein